MNPQFLIPVLTLVLNVHAAPRQEATDNFSLIILHNNDMHARFEQTDKYSNKCQKNDAELKKCYGGFARVAHL